MWVRLDGGRCGDGGPRNGPPYPPALGRAPAQPWRASVWRCGLRGPEMVSQAPRRSDAPLPRQGLLEDRLELELAADRPVGLHGLEAGHRVVVDVAVLVEAPLAVDALEVLGGGDRLAHGLALLEEVLCLLDLRRGPLDRVDDHPRALGRVERV